MSVDPNTIPGTRKAAILVTVLGVEASGPLLKNLPRKAVSEIIAEVAKLDEIDPETAQAVLESYFVEAIRPPRHHGGNEVARKLLALPELADALVPQLSPEEPESAEEILGPLLQASPATLASVLGREHVQTAALVLLNLTPEKAGPVLASLPDETRVELLKRMAEMRQVRSEVLGEVAESLKRRLNDPALVTDCDAGDSLERTAEVLRTMSRSLVRTMLDELAVDDSERAETLRGLVNTFDSLALANDRGIQELLRVTETKTLAMALHEEEPQIVEKFLKNLSDRARKMLEEEIEFLESVREEDKQTAHKEIMEQALKLEQEDRLKFEEPPATEED